MPNLQKEMIIKLIFYKTKNSLPAEIKGDHVLGKVLSLQTKGYFNYFFHEPVHLQCKMKRTCQ